ncbi:5'-nucleotidase, lipoprotein e(P4) family [Luteimonas sp. e5]
MHLTSRLPRPAHLPLLAAVLLLSACLHAPVAPPGTPATVAADDNLNAVAWMQGSAEYAQVTRSLFRAAEARLDAALASGEDALPPAERDRPAADLPPAIIVDVDETVLDNSPYQARLIAEGGEFDEAGWDRWVAQQKARPVPGAVEFARAAQARGITLLYISNRTEAQKAATLANLRAVGFPVAHDEVFMGLGKQVAGCEQQGSGKRCRRLLAARGYRIVMQFGDQLGDFVEIADNAAAARAAQAQSYASWWGERWWMLPNPSYGSWEPALYDNRRGLPRAERRAAKRAGLNKENP